MEDSLDNVLQEASSYQILAKKLPPKVAYRLRAWLRRFHPAQRPHFARMVSDKVDQNSWSGRLNKSQIGVTLHDNGAFRFDFPSELPEDVKKMAMNWAKKRGLKPIEASLAKSEGGASYAVFVNVPTAPVRQRFILEIN